jgi:hypothetical protein
MWFHKKLEKTYDDVKMLGSAWRCLASLAAKWAQKMTAVSISSWSSRWSKPDQRVNDVNLQANGSILPIRTVSDRFGRFSNDPRDRKFASNQSRCLKYFRDILQEPSPLTISSLHTLCATRSPVNNTRRTAIQSNQWQAAAYGQRFRSKKRIPRSRAGYRSKPFSLRGWPPIQGSISQIR